MQLTIQVNDESKLDFLLQFFLETSLAEVLSVSPDESSGKKQLTPEQQEKVDAFFKKQAARKAGLLPKA